ARSSRHQDDDDVSPRDEPWRPGREEPDGSTVSGCARGSRVSTGAPVAPPARSLMRMNSLVWQRPSSFLLAYAPASARIRRGQRFGGRCWRLLRAYPRRLADGLLLESP